MISYASDGRASALVEDQLTRVPVIPRPVLGVPCADASRALQIAYYCGGDGFVSFYENEPVDDPLTRRLGAWQTDTHARPRTEANQTPKF
jgi:hypothetical protein